MKIKRRFTSEGQDVFTTVEWEKRSSRITNADGSIVFEMNDAWMPRSWSQLATDIMVSKYFRKAGVPQVDDHGETLLDDDGHSIDPFVTSNGLFVGPYIGALANHDDKLAIVRGMSMETLTHEAGRRRFITGKPPSGLQARGSSTATLLASHLGVDEVIPNLSVRVESYNRDQPNYASALKVSSVPDLVRALEPGPSTMGLLEARQIDELLAQAALCPKALNSSLWQATEDSRISANTMIEQELASKKNQLSYGR